MSANKKDCANFEILMTELLAGEGTENEKRILEGHLKSCRECRTAYDKLKETWNLTEKALGQDSFDETLGPERHIGIRNAAAAPVKKRKRKSRMRPFRLFRDKNDSFMPMRVAATVIIAVALLVVLGGMLLPALSMSRSKARRISDDSNLRQIELGQGMHSKDFAETAGGADEGFAEGEDLFGESYAGEALEESFDSDQSVRKTAVSRRGKGLGDIEVETKQVEISEPREPVPDPWEYGAKSDMPDGMAAVGVPGAMRERSGKSRKMIVKKYGGRRAVNKPRKEEKSAEIGEMEGGEGRYGQPSLFSGEKDKTELGIDMLLADDHVEGPADAAVADSTAEEIVPAMGFQPEKEEDETRSKDSLFADKLRFSKHSPSRYTVTLPSMSKQQKTGEKYKRGQPVKIVEEEKRRDAGGNDTDYEPLPSPDDGGKEISERKFKLDLRLWDLTTQREVEAFLEKERYAIRGNLEAKLNVPENELLLIGEPDALDRAEDVLNGLIAEERRLRSFADGIPYISTEKKPFSTFSIDVDTASYTLARKSLREGQRPRPDTVRPEEFINYFDYRYRSPSNAVFGVYLESARNPFRPASFNLRIGVQGRKLGSALSRPTVFTILIDTSGSMAGGDRLDLVKKTMPMLLEKLKPEDKVAVLTCGDTTRLLVDYKPAKFAKQIELITEGIQARGITNLENGLIVAYRHASQNFRSGAGNRVVVFTDGITDIGSNSAGEILLKVDAARRKGITNTIVGLGGDGDDRLLEQLANKGDGNYVFVNDIEEARQVLVDQFAARFREIARDVKIQVEFNPETVSKYRQIGYMNRRLSKSDFRDDSVDAGEVGAGQSVTALYEFRFKNILEIMNPGDLSEYPPLAVVRIRYRRADNMEVEEKEYFMDTKEIKKAFEKASAPYRLSLCLAEFAEGLRFPGVPGIANPVAIAKELDNVLADDYGNDSRVRELYNLMRSVK